MKFILFLMLSFTSSFAMAIVEKDCDIYVESDAREVELTMCRTDFEIKMEGYEELEGDVFISQGCSWEQDCRAYEIFSTAPFVTIRFPEDLPDVQGGVYFCELTGGKLTYIERKISRNGTPLVCKYRDNSYIGVAYIAAETIHDLPPVIRE